MKYFSREQREILADAKYNFEFLTEKEAVAIAEEKVEVGSLEEGGLVEFLTLANMLYRGGVPLVSDSQYDFVFLAELKRRNPQHPFLQEVEPESLENGKTVKLPVRMFSTEKAYDFVTVQRWAKRIEKAANHFFTAEIRLTNISKNRQT